MKTTTKTQPVADNNTLNYKKYTGIIDRPLLTEKATTLSNNNQYMFLVNIHASKNQISEAISNIYNVEVLAVNTLIHKGKVKLTKGNLGRRKNIKKAIITLASNNNIDYNQIK